MGYSIISSARMRSADAISRPSALAVLLLTSSSNFLRDRQVNEFLAEHPADIKSNLAHPDDGACVIAQQTILPPDSHELRTSLGWHNSIAVR